MIEWVELKDFDPTGEEAYLICRKGEDIKYRIGVRYTRDNYNNNGVTHAARINFPVEKTLEDKFLDIFMEKGAYTPVGELFDAYAKIAKEHYEGKE
jgi:hypothetical protein